MFLYPYLFILLYCSTYIYCEYRLNILAELLRFGDREFYKDWWNAKTVEEVEIFCGDIFPSFKYFPSVH